MKYIVQPASLLKCDHIKDQVLESFPSVSLVSLPAPRTDIH